MGTVAESYMRMGNAQIFSHNMRRPKVVYDFATVPFWIILYMRKILFSFYQCNNCQIFAFFTVSSFYHKHCKEPDTENLKKIFPEKELRGHSPNCHIHVRISSNWWFWINQGPESRWIRKNMMSKISRHFSCKMRKDVPNCKRNRCRIFIRYFLIKRFIGHPSEKQAYILYC
jgi:hypothetical protein